MSLRIQNNVEALNAHRNLVGVNSQVTKSMERLSSGYRINRAADDAAGLAIGLVGAAVVLAIASDAAGAAVFLAAALAQLALTLTTRYSAAS